MLNIDIQGYVTQIQNFSVNDGEGLRTTIFLSGCPLRCKWCANPETWTVSPKVAVIQDKCVKCGKCLHVCPNNSIERSMKYLPIKDRCICCGSCADVCLSNARKIMGKKMSVKEVINIVKRDIIFFDESGGGVTFSGGEPTYQLEFLHALIKSLKEIGINIAIETSGYFKWEDTKDVFENIDFAFIDIKHMDRLKHKELTGIDNDVILENIKTIGKLGKDIVIRIPLIEGINDSEENLMATSSFVKEYVPNPKIEILPYHNLGFYKYESLGLSVCKQEFVTPSKFRLKILTEFIGSLGIEIVEYN
jgi:pyruvate formate lyase activating enzyme